MADELRRHGVSGSIELDEERFSLMTSGGQEYMLDNAYAEWRRAPRLRRGQVLRRYASMAELPEVPESAAEARPHLMPRVRDAEYFATLALQYRDAREGKGPAYSADPVNDDLFVEVVYDHPQAVSSIGPERLEGWGVSLEEALRTARANLRDHTPRGFDRVVPGVFASTYGDGYDAARLLLVELISRLEVTGDPVALAPHRDHLLITGSDDEAGLARIAQLAEEPLSERYRGSGLPFVLRDGSWRRFSVVPEHPAHVRFARLEALTEAANYADQQAALQQRLGEDVFVAALMLAEDEHGRLDTACAWTDGVPSLLPRAGVVAFVSPGETDADTDVMRVAWDDAVEIAGTLMKPEGLRPERWRVDSFPDPGVREQLRARAQ